MSLPVINAETNEWKELVLPSGRKISIHRWRVKEKKDFLFSIDGVEDETVVEQEIIKFISACSSSPAMFKELSESDVIFLGVELRKMSKGDDMDIMYNCPHCQSKHEAKIDISKVIDVKKFDITPFKVNDDLTINFKEISASSKKRIEAEFMAEKKITRYNYEYLLESVDSILFKDELYDNFTKEELNKFMEEDVSDTDFEKLFIELQNRMGYFSMSANINCVNPNCGKEVRITFDGLISFFAL